MYRFVRATLVVTAVTMLSLTTAHRVGAGDLLLNGSFELPPGGPSTSFTGLFEGPAAATDWAVFNNTAGNTSTSLLPTTLAGGGLQMIEVTTSGVDNGLEEVFLPPNTGPAEAMASVWVYVNAGQVGLGIGNGGDASLTAFSSTTGQWQLLQTVNLGTQTPANEFIVYASQVPASGPADFYVDLASAQATPEPSTIVLLAAGTIAFVGYGWRHRKASKPANPAAFDQQDAPAVLAFPSHSSTAHAARRAA